MGVEEICLSRTGGTAGCCCWLAYYIKGIRLRTFLAEALVQSRLEEAALKGQIQRQGHNSLARQNSISDLFEALRSVGFRNAKTFVK